MRKLPAIPPDSKRCSKSSVPNGTGRHFRRCKRRGAVEENDKLWCKQHAPSAVRARREEANKRQEQKQQRQCPNCGHTGPSWNFWLGAER